MCGIAGLIHRGRTGDVGREMTEMLKSLKHRGPDSTGYALYGKPQGKELVIRFKVAEQDEMSKGFDIHRQAALDFDQTLLHLAMNVESSAAWPRSARPSPKSAR